MSNYTCALCGRVKDSSVEEYDYFGNGVACESCLAPDEPEIDEAAANAQSFVVGYLNDAPDQKGGNVDETA